jgi:hypothetical protein
MLNLELLYLLAGIALVEMDDDALDHMNESVYADVANEPEATSLSTEPVLPYTHMLLEECGPDCSVTDVLYES